MKTNKANPNQLTAAGLRKAANLLERITVKRESLAEDETLLATLTGAPVTFGGQSPVTQKSGTRTMSEATKAKIAAGQEKRWARFHAEKANGTLKIAVKTAPAEAPREVLAGPKSPLP